MKGQQPFAHFNFQSLFEFKSCDCLRPLIAFLTEIRNNCDAIDSHTASLALAAVLMLFYSDPAQGLLFRSVNYTYSVSISLPRCDLYVQQLFVIKLVSHKLYAFASTAFNQLTKSICFGVRISSLDLR